MLMIQGFQISTKKTIPNLPKNEQNLSWNTAVRRDLKKNPKHKTTLTQSHPHTGIQATSLVWEYWRTHLRQDSWGRNAQITLKIKQSGHCVLCAPAASPQEAPLLLGPGRPMQALGTLANLLLLLCQSHFLLFCFPTRFWNSRISLC